MNQKIKSINFVLSILRLRINLPYYRSFVIPMKWTFKDKPRLYRTSYISKYLLRSLGLRYIRVLLYLALIIPIWAYLPLIALILPYVPYSPHMYSSIETAPLQNFRAIGSLFMEILHFQELGVTEVASRMQFGC